MHFNDFFAITVTVIEEESKRHDAFGIHIFIRLLSFPYETIITWWQPDIYVILISVQISEMADVASILQWENITYDKENDKLGEGSYGAVFKVCSLFFQRIVFHIDKIRSLSHPGSTVPFVHPFGWCYRCGSQNILGRKYRTNNDSAVPGI